VWSLAIAALGAKMRAVALMIACDTRVLVCHTLTKRHICLLRRQ
jgi:hypothetical protein